MRQLPSPRAERRLVVIILGWAPLGPLCHLTTDIVLDWQRVDTRQLRKALGEDLLIQSSDLFKVDNFKARCVHTLP